MLASITIRLALFLCVFNAAADAEVDETDESCTTDLGLIQKSVKFESSVAREDWHWNFDKVFKSGKVVTKEFDSDCTGSTISNCAEKKCNFDKSKCGQCRSGFTLSEDKTSCEAAFIYSCSVTPFLDSIANCEISKCSIDNDKCGACRAGFSLNEQKTACEMDFTSPCKSIKNCKKNKCNKVDDKCGECKTGFTLSLDKTACEEDDIEEMEFVFSCSSIDHCEKNKCNRNKDQCGACKTGFTLSADRTACEAKVFGLGDDGANDCPAFGEHVTTQEECMHAGSALGLTNFVAIENPGDPKGCFKCNPPACGPDVPYFWNAHPAGSAHKGRTPICVKPPQKQATTYGLADEGDNICPVSHVRVPSAEECFIAGSQLGLSNFMTIHNPHDPTGCFKCDPPACGKDVPYFWNEHPAGSGHQGRTPICAKKDDDDLQTLPTAGEEFAMADAQTVVDRGSTREIQNFDADWLFLLETIPKKAQCAEKDFLITNSDTHCYGLQEVEASTQEECREACCRNHRCELWQFCPYDGDCAPTQACWIGMGNSSSCEPSKNGFITSKRELIRRPSNDCDDARCQVDLDDSQWRTVHVPHDFVIEQKVEYSSFIQNAMGGYRGYGVGWYRKHFTAPRRSKDKAYAWLEFDGIYRNSQIWLNGQYVGGQASGYTSFKVPVSQYLKYGKDNLIVVRADAHSELEGWWYEGGGIYRHARLVFAPETHVNDLSISPKIYGETISKDGRKAKADINVVFEVTNSGRTPMETAAEVSIHNMRRNQVGMQGAYLTVPPGTTVRQSVMVPLPDANLWGTDHPYLYTAKLELFEEKGPQGKIKEMIDDTSTRFGARLVTWDKDKGLFVNNKRVKIKGFCNHQDFAGVGTAVPDRINQWKVTKLQEMGSNAWRMSHGPPNPELLDYTDQLGMLVVDEHRSYCQKSQRICNEEEFLEDLRKLVRRDRNHPSVIMWSFCNEGGCSTNANDHEALTTAMRMKSIVKEEDPVSTRPVTGAWYSQLGDLTDGWATKVMDVQGINYQYKEIKPFHERFPDKPMVSTEAGSCYFTRGDYLFQPTSPNPVDAYSAYQCTESWVKLVQSDFIAGGFGWTGFDYHGEPQPTFWPAVSSFFGVFDIAGFPKDTFHWHQAWWTDKNVLHIMPHWNLPEGFSEDLPDGWQSEFDPKTGYTYYLNPVTNATQWHKPEKDKQCDADGFPVSLTGYQCWGLQYDSTIRSLDSCVQACCEQDSCEVYSWSLDQSCFLGEMDTLKCTEAPNWIGGARKKMVKVWAFSNAKQVELFLNGGSLGKQMVPYMEKAEWKVPYEPGKLKAVGYNAAGQVVSEKTIETTGSPAKLILQVEEGHSTLRADGGDAGLVAVSVVDSFDRIVPTANNTVQFSVEGVGRILGGHNGNPASHEPDVGTSWSVFNGLARVVVGASTKPGTLLLKATSPGLQDASVAIKMLAYNE